MSLDGELSEARYDHVRSGGFRHAAKFLRWRPDEAPRRCTFEQREDK